MFECGFLDFFQTYQLSEIIFEVFNIKNSINFLFYFNLEKIYIRKKNLKILAHGHFRSYFEL